MVSSSSTSNVILQNRERVNSSCAILRRTLNPPRPESHRNEKHRKMKTPGPPHAEIPPTSDGYICFEEFALYVKVMKICEDLKTAPPPFVAVEMKRFSERFAKLQRGHERPKVSTGGGPPASPQTSPPPPNGTKESECKGPLAEGPTPPSPNNDAEKPAGGRAPALKRLAPHPPDDRRPFPRALHGC